MNTKFGLVEIFAFLIVAIRCRWVWIINAYTIAVFKIE